VTHDIRAYLNQTAELTYLTNSLGPVTTPATLTKAIDAYNKYQQQNNPNWSQQTQKAYDQVLRDGQSLLQELGSLAKQGNLLGPILQDVLKNPAADSAILLAANSKPGVQEILSNPSTTQAILGFLAAHTPSTGAAASLAKSIATIYLNNKIGPVLAQLRPDDPASFAQVRAELAAPTYRDVFKILGVKQADVFGTDGLIAKLGDELSRAPQTPAGIATAVNQFGNNIETWYGSTTAGGVLRALGVAASAAILYGDFKSWQSNPSLQNALVVGTDTLGTGQQFLDILRTLSNVKGFSFLQKLGLNDDSVLGQIVSGDKGFKGISAAKGIGIVSAAFYLANAAEQLHGGNLPSGLSNLGLGIGGLLTTDGSAGVLASLWGAAAGRLTFFLPTASAAEGIALRSVTTALAVAAAEDVLGTLTGPIGWGLILASFVGQGFYNNITANHYDGPATVAFLVGAGFTQDAANVLKGQSWGQSALPMLAQYASLKGYNLQTNSADSKQFIAWINAMSPSDLRSLAQYMGGIQHFIGGDPGALTTSPKSYFTPISSFQTVRGLPQNIVGEGGMTIIDEDTLTAANPLLGTLPLPIESRGGRTG
jgi:hypothetical protein